MGIIPLWKRRLLNREIMAEIATSVTREEEEDSKVPVVTEKDDIGLQYIAQHGIESYTPEEDRKVRWKLDLHLMPTVSSLLL